jgi:hypothetical protein
MRPAGTRCICELYWHNITSFNNNSFPTVIHAPGRFGPESTEGSHSHSYIGNMGPKCFRLVWGEGAVAAARVSYSPAAPFLKEIGGTHADFKSEFRIAANDRFKNALVTKLSNSHMGAETRPSKATKNVQSVQRALALFRKCHDKLRQKQNSSFYVDDSNLQYPFGASYKRKPTMIFLVANLSHSRQFSTNLWHSQQKPVQFCT